MTAQCGSAADVERHLRDLRDEDANVRIEALRELQTSLDQRIPEAVLPLLKDDGDSIRRIAARAIGSRWWQIQRERVPEFVRALKPAPRADDYQEQNMRNRAAGLLRRDYTGDMFVRSPNRRWVIYERRGLPCLIDTTNETEELLGWGYRGDDEDYPRRLRFHGWGNDDLKGAAFWHPKREVVALSLGESRHSSSAWVWQHRGGFRRLSDEKLLAVLPSGEARWMGNYGFSISIEGWRGDAVEMEVGYTVEQGGDYFERSLVARWDPSTDTLRLISHAKE